MLRLYGVFLLVIICSSDRSKPDEPITASWGRARCACHAPRRTGALSPRAEEEVSWTFENERWLPVRRDEIDQIVWGGGCAHLRDRLIWLDLDRRGCRACLREVDGPIALDVGDHLDEPLFQQVRRLSGKYAVGLTLLHGSATRWSRPLEHIEAMTAYPGGLAWLWQQRSRTNLRALSLTAESNMAPTPRWRDLARLRELRFFDLSASAITDADFRSIQELPLLSLRVRAPHVSAESLGVLTKLEHLEADVGAGRLAGLTELKELTLIARTGSEFDLSGLGTMRSLETLTLHGLVSDHDLATLSVRAQQP